MGVSRRDQMPMPPVQVPLAPGLERRRSHTLVRSAGQLHLRSCPKIVAAGALITDRNRELVLCRRLTL